MAARHGVLAFGDSITNGGGELQWGVALQSWALWTARGLGLPYTGCAVDGADVAALRGVEAGRALDDDAGLAGRGRGLGEQQGEDEQEQGGRTDAHHGRIGRRALDLSRGVSEPTS